MNKKEFYKRFEEIVNEIFGENQRQSTSMDGFFKGLNNENLSDEIKKIRDSVRKNNDGFFTSISFIINPKEQEVGEDSLKDLKKKLEQCVKSQEFEEAAKLRDRIKQMENSSSKVMDLKKEMEIAIKEQNFERAIEIRDELKKIN